MRVEVENVAVVQHIHWIAAVDADAEGMVARQALQLVRHLLHDLRRDGERMHLLRPQVAHLMAGEEAHALLVCGDVRTARVPHAALPEHNAAGFHLDLNGLHALIEWLGPAMAEGYEVGSAVVLGEVIERKQGVTQERWMRTRYRPQAVVLVQILLGLAGQRVEQRGDVQLVVLADDAVDDGAQAGVQEHEIRGAGLGEQVVRPPGAPARGAEAATNGNRNLGVEGIAERLDVVRCQEAIDHGVALSADLLDHLADV